MIVRAFRSLPAMTALMPTDPTPNTASVLPSRTSRTLSTAPAPVCTPHPSGAKSARSVSGGTFTRLERWTRAWRANELWPKKELNVGVFPSSNSRALVPSGRLPPKLRRLKEWQ